MPGRSDRATTKIFVGNLPDRYPDDSLRELFEQYGEVSECDVIKNFAFVHFVSEDEAEAAVKGLNGAEVKGKNIRVEISEKVRLVQRRDVCDKLAIRDPRSGAPIVRLS